MLALVERGYAIFEPNVRGSTGRGREFAALVVGDMGGGDVGDMLRGLDHLVAEGLADAERVGIMGQSYGGFMACWLPTQDARFKAAVALSPVTNWYSERYGSNLGAWVGDFLDGEPRPSGGQYYERSPVLFASADRTPTLLTAGLLDRATPPDQAIEFHNALVEQGVASDVVVYPGEGHGVHTFPAVIDCTTRIVAWFERHMPRALARARCAIRTYVRYAAGMAPAKSSLRWSLAGTEQQGSLLDDDVDPTRELREVEYLHVRARSIISEVPRASRMPFRYTINPYRGCSHACTYCFARPTHEYLGLNGLRGLRAAHRRQDQRRAAARGGACAAELGRRAHRDGHEHRSLPAGRGPLQAHARHRRDARRGAQPLLGAHEVDDDPARPRRLRGRCGAHRA